MGHFKRITLVVNISYWLKLLIDRNLMIFMVSLEVYMIIKISHVMI